VKEAGTGFCTGGRTILWRQKGSVSEEPVVHGVTWFLDRMSPKYKPKTMYLFVLHIS